MAGQLTYGLEMRPMLEGAPEHAVNYDRLSFTNPLSVQVTTLTVGATLAASSSYTYTATNPDGIAASVTVTYVGAPATVTVVATDIAAAINASSQFIGIASATSAVGVVTVTFRRPLVYTNATVVTGASVALTAANTATAGGSYVRVGVFVKKGAGDRELTPITDATTIAQIMGLALRTSQIISGESFGLAYDAYRPGDEVAVGRSERVPVKVYEAVTPTSVPYIWIEPTVTTVPLGGLVKSTDGGGLGSAGDAIDASSICRFLSTAAAGELAWLEIFKGV